MNYYYQNGDNSLDVKIEIDHNLKPNNLNNTNNNKDFDRRSYEYSRSRENYLLPHMLQQNNTFKQFYKKFIRSK